MLAIARFAAWGASRPARSRFVLWLAALALPAGASLAQELDTRLPGTDGPVTAMARSGHTLYLAGPFSAVGTCTGGGVPLGLRTGRPLARYPRVVGTVDAVAPDGRGGWFLGGLFSCVEGEPRANLAHVNGRGELSRWSPSAPNGRIAAFALVGRVLYVGGSFSTLNGRTRNNLAALDAHTGELLPWNPGANAAVRTLLVQGRRLLVGGTFTLVEDSLRNHLAAFDLRTGAVTPWNPNADGNVLSLLVHGASLFVAGEFDHVGGLDRNSVAALDLGSGRVTGWDAALRPRRRYVAHGNWIWPWVEGLSASGNTVFISGCFDSTADVARRCIAALDVRTARPTAFDARFQADQPERFVYANALAARGRTLYVGGTFSNVGGRERINLAALDTQTGDATAWNPRAAGPSGPNYGATPWRTQKCEGVVSRLVPDGAVLFAGGSMTQVDDWQPRNHLAAIDLSSGQLLPWAPTTDGYRLNAIASIGNTVYFAGSFNRVNGEPRWNIAAVDGASGALRPWDPMSETPRPGILTEITTLATDQHVLYASGYIYGIHGRDVNNVVGIDPITGNATNWNPHANAGARAILPTPAAVYLCGDFSEIGGVSRPALAALDPLVGNAQPWNPAPSGPPPLGSKLYTLAAGDDAIYVGGSCQTMGGLARTNAAALDPVTGAPRPWNPAPDDLVEAAATLGGSVWLGGRFLNVGGKARAYLTTVDTAAGDASSWDPRANGEVLCLLAGDQAVYVGGAFTSMCDFPRVGFAAIRVQGASAGEVTGTAPDAKSPAAFTWNATCPVRGDGWLSYVLPQSTTVDIRLFDLQGRCVALLVRDEWQASGAHELAIHASAWAPGVYLCRMSAGGRAKSRKLIVIR